MMYGLVRGAPCRGIAAAGSHGLRCEYGCRDQHADAKVTLVIRFRHMTEAKEARLRKCLERRALRGISSSAFNEALASLIIGSLDTTLTLK